ncbi:hypothetical protein N2603_39105 [Bradyrhizobium huanghuaihaiense]|nr:hypothetical protein [Bradyrhizobium sp. CB3035]UWU81507.1 hypothetical protein N2603_39105 [Bradyrhizobium sp. CB3035]
MVDPAHMNYISGFDSWSYQNTQVLLVPGNDLEPVWIERGVDAGGARQTTWLSSTISCRTPTSIPIPIHITRWKP